MSYPMIHAKPISYGGARSLSNIKYIAIHNTGNVGDTARNNANFFGPSGSNKRIAGAHFFVDQSGSVYQSVPINLSAWSVGDNLVTRANGAASMNGICTNFNSVSIELCDIVTKNPSQKMIDATRELVKYIQSQCPNAKTFVRHWDVTGKSCPERMKGASNSLWASFKAAISSKSSKIYAIGAIQYGQEIYKAPNGANTHKFLPKGTLVYCYGTYNDNKKHTDGLNDWCWWAINPERTEWVVYTKRIKNATKKVYAKGEVLSGQEAYKSPNGTNTHKMYSKGAKVNCYATFTDHVKHNDGLTSWVWWRITPLLEEPLWLVYTKRIKLEGKK